jgi:hypothetical protein
MAELVKAIGDFVAALLGLAGFVGKPRRRAAIAADLQLLHQLEEHPDFAASSLPHAWLTNHIMLEIGSFSGLDLRSSRRKADLSSIVINAIVLAVLTWLTYRIFEAGHPWYAAIPGIPAFLLGIAELGMVTEKEDVIPEQSGEGASNSATAD